MGTHITWSEIALRLALTVVAGVVVGFDRSEHGKAAGIRTTLFVCLAASLAMIQVNLLLPLSGRTSDSFIMNDLMRLPLGILTGVGFIGGGAILQKENMVVGVTTAATLWLVTVIGLCLGGGQIAVGLVVTIIAVVALTVLKRIEAGLRRDRRANLDLELAADGPDEQELRRRMLAAGWKIERTEVTLMAGSQLRRVLFGVRELRRESETESPPLVSALAGENGVLSVKWRLEA
jgi:putative Mg2+ transporter-C (MgtC) family protein